MGKDSSETIKNIKRVTKQSVQIWVHWVNVIITFWLSSSLLWCEYMTNERGITSMPTMSVNIRLNISELHECNFHY
jgi:hypothetical protein